MVNFGPPETVPERFRHRRLYRHNPNVTLMRTTVEENRELGRILAEKTNAARGPVVLMLPARGVSAIDRVGEPFDDPQARAALFDALRRHARTARIVELDLHINDPEFAEAAARELIALLNATAAQQSRTASRSDPGLARHSADERS